jgi:hypothetical protein
MKPMREKLLWITVVILGVVLTASHAQSPSPRLSPTSALPSNPGRYQITAGPDPIDGTAATHLYRVDTANGRTWVLGLVAVDHGESPEWMARRGATGPHGRAAANVS